MFFTEHFNEGSYFLKIAEFHRFYFVQLNAFLDQKSPGVIAKHQQKQKESLRSLETVYRTMITKRIYAIVLLCFLTFSLALL